MRAVAFLAVAASCSSAQATSLPPAIGSIGCDALTGNISSTVSCNGGADSGSIIYFPFASVQASAFGEGLVDDAGATSILNYSLEVTGGNVGDIVPLNISAVLEAIPKSIGYAFSEIIASADSSDDVTICSSGCGVSSGVSSFAGTLNVNAVSGTVYTNAIHLEAEAVGALGNGSYFDGGTASADPLIVVDPSFAGAGRYQILLSDGIGNGIATTSAVPEPATWALMLMGIGIIGTMARRLVRGVASC